MIFSGDELLRATSYFSEENMVGKGGFGRVFRGKLRHSEVAIKVLNTVRSISNCYRNPGRGCFCTVQRGVQSIMRAKSECLLSTEVSPLTRFVVVKIPV